MKTAVVQWTVLEGAFQRHETSGRLRLLHVLVAVEIEEGAGARA